MTNALMAPGLDRRFRRAAFLGAALVWLGGSGPAPADAAAISGLRRSGSHLSKHDAQAFQNFLAGGPAVWATHKDIPIPAGVPITNPDGTLRNTPVVSYLTWWRNQNPATFDLIHPRLATLFSNPTPQQPPSFTLPPSLTPPATPTTAQTQQAQLAEYNAALANSSDPAQQIRNAQIALTTGTARSGISAEYLVLRGPLPNIHVPRPAPASGSVPTPVPSAEVMPAPVPEPSSVLTTLAVFGLAGGWWRSRNRRNVPA